MDTRPFCGAHARSTGESCRKRAMANGRCRLHGGMHPIKHGRYTKKAVEAHDNYLKIIEDFKTAVVPLDQILNTIDKDTHDERNDSE